MKNNTDTNINKKINLILRPSRFFFTLISGLHLIILFLISILEIDLIKIIVLLIILLLSYSYMLRRYIYRKYKYAVIHLWQDIKSNNPHEWELKLSNSKIIKATLKSKGYMSNYLIILHFVIFNNKSSLLNSIKHLIKFNTKTTISVLIFPDMIDNKDYHRLMMFLKGY